MASDSATAKGKKAVGKRGHPAAANIDNSRSFDQDNNDLEDVSVPPTKKRRGAANASNISSPPVSASKDRKNLGSQVQTSPVKPTKSGGRAATRGRNAKAQSVSPTPQPPSRKTTANSKQGTVEDWSNEDLTKLIENLMAHTPKPDTVKYSTQVEKVPWEKVQFDDHTGEECKAKWGVIMTKLRRYRTLGELVTDAKEWVKHPWMTYNNSKGKPKPPGLPKKPLTPYFRYFLEKREKHSRENPEMSMTDLAKLLAKKFADLPDKKKMKYKESYEKENEIYKAAMEKFKGEHPEMFPEVGSKSHGQGKQNGPLKPQTALQMFLAEKMNKYLNDDRSNKKDIEDKYKNQWKNLSDSKRVRWIKKAMGDEERFAAELAEYRLSHPDFKPEQKKSAISKAEKEIKDKFDGKPDRPPNSGYSLYSKIMLKELKDIPSKEKMGEISRRWKELSDKERQSYAKQATEAITRYQQEYKLYVSNLTEDERKKLEEEEKKRKKKSPGAKAQANSAAAAKAAATATDHEITPSKPKKPMSALFFYQQEKLAQYKTKNPDRSEQELTRQIAREYNELTEKKKEKYKKMAEEAKKTYEQATSTKESELRAKIQKTEPKKPPQSGYSVFTSEMMSKLTDVEAKFRMSEVSKRWGAMTDAEKEKYKRQAVDMGKKYQKEIGKFLSTLSEDEQKVYQQMKAKKPARRNTKTQAAAAAAAIKQEESSNSSDEESSKEENKDSSSSDSGSGSGSDSSSESDNSESDSDSDSKSEESGSEKDDTDEDSDDDACKVQRGSGNSSSGESDGSNSGSASESESEEE